MASGLAIFLVANETKCGARRWFPLQSFKGRDVNSNKTGTALQLEQFLPYRLSVLANTVSNALSGVYRERFGLTIPDWRLIAVLARFPGSSAQALVDHTRMDKVAISRSVARLETRGLITRELSESDRRSFKLVLTAEGEAIYRDIVPLARALESELEKGLDPEERARLDDLLGRLQAVADTLGTAADN